MAERIRMQIRDVEAGQFFKMKDSPNQRFLKVSGRNWEPLIVSIPGYHGTFPRSMDLEVEVISGEEAREWLRQVEILGS